MGPCGASSAAGAGSGAGGCVAHGAGAPPGRVAGAPSVYHWDASADDANSPDSSGRSPFATGIVHSPVCPAGSGAGSGSGSAGTASAKFHWAVVDDVCPYCEVSGYGCWYGSCCWFGSGQCTASGAGSVPVEWAARSCWLCVCTTQLPVADGSSPAAGVSGRIIGGT
ncbi:hypothetical protein EES40_14050 [Streptomyces sp. ADI93-02]|nr:hypothetical protein EES40_14050 [Streptomyces sp. ADI93-02]